MEIILIILVIFIIKSIFGGNDSGKSGEPKKKHGLADMTDEEILMCMAVDDEWDLQDDDDD